MKSSKGIYMSPVQLQASCIRRGMAGYAVTLCEG